MHCLLSIATAASSMCKPSHHRDCDKRTQTSPPFTTGTESHNSCCDESNLVNVKAPAQSVQLKFSLFGKSKLQSTHKTTRQSTLALQWVTNQHIWLHDTGCNLWDLRHNRISAGLTLASEAKGSAGSGAWCAHARCGYCVAL